MARNNNTPVTFWLSLPLVELAKWVSANNAIERELEDARQNR